MSQAFCCPRCAENFSATVEGYDKKIICPMCGAELPQLSVDHSVDPHADMHFQVDEHAIEQSRTEKLADKTLWPMVGLLATAGLGAYVGLQQCILVVYGKANGMADLSSSDERDIARNFGIAITTFVMTGTSIIVLPSAICLHTRRFFTLAIIGCALASIPCLSPGIILGMPFGIWGMLLLNNRDIRKTFR